MFLTYWSRSTSIAITRSAIVSCSTTFFRRINSLECLIRFSGTLAIKFQSKRTLIILSLTSPLVFCDSVASTNEIMGRERYFSTSINACDIKKLTSFSCSAPRDISANFYKKFMIHSDYRFLKVKCLQN